MSIAKVYFIMIATKDFSAPSTSHHHECHQHPHQPHNLLIHFLYKGNLTTGYGYAVGHRYPNNVTNTFKSNQKMRWIKLVYVFFGDSNSCTFVLAKVKMRGLNFQLICNRKLDFLHPPTLTLVLSYSSSVFLVIQKFYYCHYHSRISSS